MTDMNGHEETSVQSHHAAGAFHAHSINAPTTEGLTKQQRVILQHLQTGESITPYAAKYKYQCKSLSSVISGLKGKGWKIDGYRRRDSSGKPFTSYKLWSRYTKVDGREAPGPLFDDVNPDPVPRTATPPELEPTAKIALEAAEMILDKAPRITNLSLIKEHLIKEKAITTQAAMELYAVSAASLRSSISALRKKHGMSIATVPVPDSDAYYRLIDAPDDAVDQDLVPDNEPEDSTGADTDPETALEEEILSPGSKPTPDIPEFSKVLGVLRTKDGIELRLGKGGDHDDMPPHKLTIPDAEYVLISLKRFLDMGP